MPKDDKVYEQYNVDLSINLDSRELLMKKMVERFISEKPGYWKDGVKHVTRYNYFVEKIADGRRIYLKRPTHLNKGIDFQVWVEKMMGEKDARPRHSDFYHDIEKKYNENKENVTKLLNDIEKVWNCQNPDEVIKEIDYKFKEGYSIELLLKMLKWLFIEQDITYWNYDGRGMLKMAIFNHVNKLKQEIQVKLQ